MSSQHQKLYQYAFEIKIKKIKVINMVYIKRNTHIVQRNIFSFSQKTFQTKSQENLPKNLPN